MPAREFDGGSRIVAGEELRWGRDIAVGPDVRIECERLYIGDNVRLGAADEASFRHPGGLRIRARDLHLGDGVRIGRETLISGGDIRLEDRVRVAHSVTINVKGSMRIGSGGTVHDRCEITGMRVDIGRRLWMLPDAKIGGGGAFEVHSEITIGHWAHLGVRSLLNTARPITIGDEVGLGTGTSLYTHGAYPSAIEGKPVAFAPITIGDRTWIPGAVINPGVTIGADCVVAVGSVVTRDLPDGCLAAGAPAKVVKENAYPRPMSDDELVEFMADFLTVFAEICSDEHTVTTKGPGHIVVDGYEIGFEVPGATIELRVTLGAAASDEAEDRTIIGLRDRRIIGASTDLTERLLNQLRRYGLRFNYDASAATYVRWPI